MPKVGQKQWAEREDRKKERKKEKSQCYQWPGKRLDQKKQFSEIGKLREDEPQNEINFLFVNYIES